MNFAIVFVGAGIGGAARHAVYLAAARAFGTGFPVGTLLVNVLGSVLIGLIAGYFEQRASGDAQLRLFLTVGVLGGFTTFSAFSLDALVLMERNQVGNALLYVLLSVGLAVAGTYAGLLASRL